MTSIADMLDTQARERLQHVVAAEIDVDAPAKPDNLRTTASGITYRVIKPAVDPRPLTESDAIDIDPESEAMIEAECVDCHSPILIAPQLPEGVDPEAPRVPVCSECAKARVRHAAFTAQRNVEAIRRTTVAKHQPRTSDGIEHPVTTIKEQDMTLDIDTMTDAELGAMVRKQMKASIAEAITTARPEVEAERRQREEANLADIAVEQVERKERVYPAFEYKGVEVPEMDLRDSASLQEIPDAKTRSPYNKMRYRSKEAGFDKENPPTYADLVADHERFLALALGVERPVTGKETAEVLNSEPEAEKPKKAKKGKGKKTKAKVEVQTPVQVVAAGLSEHDPALVRAVMGLYECDEAEAVKRLAAMA